MATRQTMILLAGGNVLAAEQLLGGRVVAHGRGELKDVCMLCRQVY